MANFDGTIDNRWRPDLESSQRRVRGEEKEDEAPIWSRELTVVPRRQHRPAFAAHDPETLALIRRLDVLERLPHGAHVSKLLSEWNWLDRMSTPELKQRFLEPIIEGVQRDPEKREGDLIVLLLVIEPLRRSVSREFAVAQSGLQPSVQDVSWGSREEARRIAEIDRQAIFDVTREAALEAIFRYPNGSPPDKFFPWVRETLAHRALDKLTSEITEPDTMLRAAEAEAVQGFLHGFELVSPPPMSEGGGLAEWRSRIHMRDVFDVVEDFYSNNAVREACRDAIGRLPRRQREVIDGYFFEEASVESLAEQSGVATSTIYNHKAKAQTRMAADDLFFGALSQLGRVRDSARRAAIEERYPAGVMPDGRRRVVIDRAA